MSFRSIFGSLRILRRRSNEVGRPGLTIWADAGERAATTLQVRIRDEAYCDEQCDAEAEKDLEEALRDGLDDRDLPLVKKALRNVRRSKAAAQRIGEVAS